MRARVEGDVELLFASEGLYHHTVHDFIQPNHRPTDQSYFVMRQRRQIEQRIVVFALRRCTSRARVCGLRIWACLVLAARRYG